MNRIASLILAAALAFPSLACETTAAQVAVQTAQVVLEPYGFTFVGEASGILGVNTRYLAVDALVDLTARYYGPDPDTQVRTLLWEKSFKKGKGKRAYRIVFGSDKFVRIVPVEWDEAALSLGLPLEDS